MREPRVAALGAIGDDRGLDAILAATADKPAIRRRAVLALAPFVAPEHPRAAEVAAALERALTDRDWQVRQAAEDLAAIDTPRLTARSRIRAERRSGRRCSGRRRRGSKPMRWYSRLAASRDGRLVRLTSLAPRRRASSSAARLSASPTPWPRAASSTTTSSIHALSPVGMR